MVRVRLAGSKDCDGYVEWMECATAAESWQMRMYGVSFDSTLDFRALTISDWLCKVRNFMFVFHKQGCQPPLRVQSFALITLWFTSTCAFLWLLLSQPVFSQVSSGSENTPPLIADGLIQSNQRIWVVGKDGRPMLNITIQELQEMERRIRETSELPVQLTKANLNFQVVEAVVDIAAEFGIESPGGQVVRRFDLKMGNCQLTQMATFVADSTEPSVSVENTIIPTDEGYRWLHLASQPGKHTVRMEAKSLVAENSDRRTVALELPQVATSIDFHLPPNSIEIRVRNDDLIESRTVDEKGIHLKIRSRGGSFVLSWRQSTAVAQVAAVEAKCDTRYEPVDLLDATQLWSATSTVSIRWYGNQANNRVQIVLPTGAQWGLLPAPEPDRYRLTTLMPAEENSVEIIEIEILDPSEYPTVENLKLQWRWLPQNQEVDGFSARLKLPVPQVRGADSIEGNIELVYPSSFQALFQAGPGVRYVEQIRMSSLVGRQQMLFQYKGQEAPLDLTFRKEQFQPIVRPIYRVHVHEQKLELTAWYKCTFDGNNSELGLVPGDWIIDEDSVCRLVNESQPDSQECQPLSIQKIEGGNYILSSRPQDDENEQSRGEQFWRFSAWRSYEQGDNTIQFQLPKFDRGRAIGQQVVDHGSGALLLSSENFLWLQTDEPKVVGLLRDSSSRDYSNFVLSQFRQPTAFRFHRQGAVPTWLGQVRHLPRQVRAEQSAALEILDGRVLVKQDFQVQIANRSLNDLRVLVHERATPVSATVSGFSLSFEEAAETSASNPSGWRVYRLAGLPELLGHSQIFISSTVAWRPLDKVSEGADAAGLATSIDVPLVRLLVDELEESQSSRCSVVPSNTFDIKPLEQATRVDANAFELPAGRHSVKLAVQQKTQSQTAAVITRGTWLQTMLNGTERRDRFVARVKSKNKQVFVQLPSQAQLDRVALDGIQLSSDAAPYDYSSRQATISMPDDQEHTVEVLYLLTEPLNRSITYLQLNSANVVDAESQERFYWQLVTPDVFHLGWCPRSLTAEWRWQWNLLAWNRVSDEDQVSLENLLVATPLARIPASTNSYVMSGFEDSPQVEVWILSRFVLWLPMGALTIIVTMLLLNVAFLRTPTSLILMGSALVAMALIWPDFSILLGQTAAASVGLVALIWITQAAVQSRVKRRSVFSTRPATNADISDQQHSAARSARSQANQPIPSPVNLD